MTTKHTAEPCRFVGTKLHPESTVYLWFRGKQHSTEYIPKEVQDHIAACVNGCRGITDPETTVPALAQALSNAQLVMEALTNGRSTVVEQTIARNKELLKLLHLSEVD